MLNNISVVVARPNELCLGVRASKDIHCIRSSPLDGCQGP